MTNTKKMEIHGGMSFMQRKVLNKFYVDAKGERERLPWHRDDPPEMLARIATQRQLGRALDVGCGSGIFSAFLASVGYMTTAIDLHEDAVRLARLLANDEPSFDVIQADALEYRPDIRFDLVYDSGCMYNLKG